MFLFDPLYLIIIGPAILLALYAQYRVSSAFKKYSQVAASSGMTGAEVAGALLQQADARPALVKPGLEGQVAQRLAQVRVEALGGHLNDHYDPRHRVLRLSEPVYASNSLAALGVAAHETGHAFQHAEQYGPLALRSAMVPAVGFGSSVWPLMFLVYFFTGSPLWIDLAILAFIGVLAFSLVTLPVEFNASARALRMLTAHGYVSEHELPAVRRVLNAAALTYVASAAMALLTLAYLLLLRGRR